MTAHSQGVPMAIVPQALAPTGNRFRAKVLYCT